MDVLVSLADSNWSHWGERFVKRQPLSRVQHLVPAATTAEGAKSAIIRAINTAGVDGRVIMNVGHGGSGATTTEGKFEMAPGGVLTIGGRDVANCYVDVFYDVKPSSVALSGMEYDLANNPTSERMAHWKVYQEIAKTFKAVKPREVVLLVCKVGNATEFLRKVANDWGVIITAYKQRVASIEDVVTIGKSVTQHYYLYLENDYPLHKSAAELVIHEEELPYRPADTFHVGPPLGT